VSAADRLVYTVAELTARLRAVLEEQVAPFWVEGEISNLRIPGSGHAYFTLKDDQAQIRAVLFRNRSRRIRFEPADGLHVLAFGSLEVYAPRGEYQMVVELMEPKGIGALQVAFEQLKARLQAEGLFDAARKRPLPRFPRKIGIVTSPTGAAIRDMLRVIRRRFGDLHIVIRPVRVQGEGAAREIAAGVGDLNLLGDVDVIIVARGGGALEDLWAFNEEVVARAIVASKAPVVSGVGHEVDFTIADFVADLRAPTPSAAAELVVREKEAVVEGLRDLHHRLVRAFRRRLEGSRERLGVHARRRVLTDPSRPLRDAHRRLDDLAGRLRAGLVANRRSGAHRLALATQRLHSSTPAVRISSGRGRLGQLWSRLGAGTRRSLDRSQQRFRVAAGQLDGLSPLAVLGRGYSLTQTPAGVIVRRAGQVAPGEPVRVLLYQGRLDCLVVESREQNGRSQV
jgi:exodeoxyribonuclease VII large subunit